MRKHGESDWHTKMHSGATSIQASAPPREDFEAVLLAVSSGTASHKGVKNAQGKKFRRIALCLANALKINTQRHIRHAESITLARDARKSRTCIRLAVIDRDLQAFSGMLCWAPLRDSSADGILKATNQGFKTFSTRLVGGAAPKFIPECRRILRLKTHVTTTDAASAEVLATDMSRKRFIDEPLTPHAKILVKDRAHGTRRLGSRPYNGVPQLYRTFARFIRAKTSPAQLIQYSPELRMLWQDVLCGCFIKVHSLRAAKHRYESWAKPAARTCILCLYVMKFVIKLLSRRQKLVTAATRFLEFVSFREWIILACQAEANDELMQLVRFNDKSEVKIEDASVRYGTYFARLHYLFGPERGALRDGSFVSHVIEMFSHHKVAWQLRGRFCSLGGCAPQAVWIDEAFELMRGWVTLSLAEARAEMPDCDLALSLAVLHKPWDSEDVQPFNDFERLALLIDADAFDLYELLQRAVRIIKNNRLHIDLDEKDTTLQVWQRFVKLIRHDINQHKEFRIFLKLLVRWRGLRFSSSSGVEQTFTRCLLFISNRMQRANWCYEECLAHIVQDGRNAPRARLLDDAVASWTKFSFGVARLGASRAPRVDTGSHRAQRHGSEAAFLGRRRALACETVSYREAAARIESDIAPIIIEQAAGIEFQNEIAFTERKAKKRLHEAIHDGMALYDERTPADVASAEARHETRMHEALRRRRARGAAVHRHEGRSEPLLTKEILRGKCSFLTDDDLHMVAHAASLARVHDIEDADLVCHIEPGLFLPKLEWFWDAVLRGLFVCSNNAIQHGRGLAIRYLPALNTKRAIYVSPAFAAKHAGIMARIQRCVAMGPRDLQAFGCGPVSGRWKFIHAEADFLAQKAVHADSRFVALCLKSERDSAPLLGIKHVFTGPDFLKFNMRIDAQASFFG